MSGKHDGADAGIGVADVVFVAFHLALLGLDSVSAINVLRLL